MESPKEEVQRTQNPIPFIALAYPKGVPDAEHSPHDIKHPESFTSTQHHRLVGHPISVDHGELDRRKIGEVLHTGLHRDTKDVLVYGHLYRNSPQAAEVIHKVRNGKMGFSLGHPMKIRMSDYQIVDRDWNDPSIVTEPDNPEARVLWIADDTAEFEQAKLTIKERIKHLCQSKEPLTRERIAEYLTMAQPNNDTTTTQVTETPAVAKEPEQQPDAKRVRVEEEQPTDADANKEQAINHNLELQLMKEQMAQIMQQNKEIALENQRMKQVMVADEEAKRRQEHEDNQRRLREMKEKNEAILEFLSEVHKDSASTPYGAPVQRLREQLQRPESIHEEGLKGAHDIAQFVLATGAMHKHRMSAAQKDLDQLRAEKAIMTKQLAELRTRNEIVDQVSNARNTPLVPTSTPVPPQQRATTPMVTQNQSSFAWMNVPKKTSVQNDSVTQTTTTVQKTTTSTGSFAELFPSTVTGIRPVGSKLLEMGDASQAAGVDYICSLAKQPTGVPMAKHGFAGFDMGNNTHGLNPVDPKHGNFAEIPVSGDQGYFSFSGYRRK